MTTDKIKCKLEKVGKGRYRVLRWKSDRWQAWLENTTFDPRANSSYNAYYPTPEDAKEAAKRAAYKERKDAAENEEFEV